MLILCPFTCKFWQHYNILGDFCHILLHMRRNRFCCALLVKILAPPLNSAIRFPIQQDYLPFTLSLSHPVSVGTRVIDKILKSTRTVIKLDSHSPTQWLVVLIYGCYLYVIRAFTNTKWPRHSQERILGKLSRRQFSARKKRYWFILVHTYGMLTFHDFK